MFSNVKSEMSGDEERLKLRWHVVKLCLLVEIYGPKL